MRLARFSPVTGRVFCFALVLVLALTAAPVVRAQEAPKPTLVFNGDVGLIFIFVKADQTAPFEEMVTKLKDGLAKVDTPEVKQQIASLKLLKAPNGPAPAGATLYIIMADPTVKNIEYWFLSLLYKMYPAEAKALYDQWMAVKHTTNPVPYDLALVMKMQ